jgi:predicted oxidoreductase
VINDKLADLVAGMNALSAAPLLEFATVEREVVAGDLQLENPFGKDSQLALIRQTRSYVGDRLIRVAKPHAIIGPKAGPLIAVKLSILSRTTLGGLETDLRARVFGTNGEVIPGLYAVGAAAGFGGGGVHGYRSLEGTFLGGCIFFGRIAGRAAAAAV